MSRIIRAAAMCAAALLVSVGATGVAVAKPKPPAPQTTWYFQGFEQNTDDWFGDITRQADGYTNGGGYADGIDSAFGTHHARLGLGGAYTDWGRGLSDTTFPEPGYVSNLDVYLDTAYAATAGDKRFDIDLGTNRADGDFFQDYVFNAGTVPTGFVVGSSTNAGRGSTFPANPCPSPSTGDNACRAPVTITQSGWYSFRYTVRDVDNQLRVRMQILDHDQQQVPGADWTIVGRSPADEAGGPSYLWTAQQEIQDLAIDDTVLAPLQPQNKEDCKNGLWQMYSNPSYKNQGQCEKALKH